ncbi:hypothetical protein [Candidatus Enterovibrio escicola]|uniref:Mobile element protein n=1 Tax=Candidatus Enterovibrio escicola TaxID=1927127 RepID=A0A2A5T4R2_9GAMM|nr:hypothetical protein [Candidatus Enterovibrio escacola]PCS23136.1 Mobile element protein [Candidatus Enterovibrio escacola]
MVSRLKTWYRDLKSCYIHFIYRSLPNAFPELVSYTRMFKRMQYVLVHLCSYLTHRQALPSLICPSYRFVTTSAFSDIRFLKVPRSEKKERWGGSTA